MSRERRVHWVWAVAPDEPLRRLARSLERGTLPEGHEVIKANPRRTVYRVPLAGERPAAMASALLVKHFRVLDWEALRFAVLPSRARHEFRVMEEFCRLGVPAVRPVAFGERRRGGSLAEAWFAAAFVDGACTLYEALDALTSDDDRFALAERAVDLVAELHEHPFVHLDLHGGNVLVTAEDELLVLDLHSVRRVPRLIDALARRNLGRFLFSLRRWIDLDRAPELARRYAERRGILADPWVVGVGPAIDAFERRHVASRTRRCIKDSTEFVRGRGDFGRVFRRRDYEADALDRDLALHARVVKGGARARGEWLGRSERSHVTRVGDRDPRVVKHELDAGIPARLRQLAGLGRARGAWLAARELEVRDIATPRGLALVERADGSAVLVTRALGDTVSLREFAARLEIDPAPRRRRHVAQAVGDLVGRLARAGLRHSDLSSKNLLICEGPAPRAQDVRLRVPERDVHVALIDLDGMRRTRAFDERSLARMLSQLGDLPPWVGARDRLRFVSAYRRVAGRALPPRVVELARELTRKRQERRSAVAAPKSVA